MSSRSLPYRGSFPFWLYILSLRCHSSQSCDQFENQCFFTCSCKQFGKLDLRGVGLLRTSFQLLLRWSEISARLLLYLLLNHPITPPCGFVIKQKRAECRDLTRRIRNSLRISISLVARANQCYSDSTYSDPSCEKPVRSKPFVRIDPFNALFNSPFYSLFYSTPVLALSYPGYPCEQPAQSEFSKELFKAFFKEIFKKNFKEKNSATTIYSFLRKPISMCLIVPCETLKSHCLKRTFSTSWDRSAFNIAIKDFSCTGIPINTS
jgi:hypothetical protein